MQVIFLIFLFILGSCVGSFLCCMVRRLHFEATNKSEHSSKKIKSKSKTKTKSKTDKSQSSKTKKSSKSLGHRSVCLKCHYQLKWYDNIPIISWLFLRGRCRKCHKPIGLAEIISEVGLGVALVGLGWTLNITTVTGLEWVLFIVTALLGINLAFLAIYDGLYGELPTIYLITAISLGLGVAIVKQILLLTMVPFSIEIILNPLFSVLILGGLYLLLYLISKGGWVGDGDWILGTAVGLALASPWLAAIALCIANTLAFLYALPTIKKAKNHKIHFGPFMVTAFFIAVTFSNFFCRLVQ